MSRMVNRTRDATASTAACAAVASPAAGINVIIFRGSERNKRRGFHNLYAFNRRLRKELKAHVRRAAAKNDTSRTEDRRT
jgi:hypothetical protein